MSITIEPGLVLYSREEWGARTKVGGYPRLGHSVNRLDRTEAIMHHTVIIDNDATPNRWETLAEVFAKMRQLQTIRPDLGLDVPYNFVAFHMADSSLIICEGRGFDLTGAHTHGHNTEGIATAGEGNFMIGQTVSPYIDHWSCWWGYQRYNMGMENLGSKHPVRGIAYGHKDFIATGCPGDKLYAIIPQLIFKKEEEGDDMQLYAGIPSGRIYVVNAEGKRYIGPVEYGTHQQAGLMAVEVSDTGLKAIPNLPKPSDIREWARRGARDAIDDRLTEIAEAVAAEVVKELPTGSDLTQAQIENAIESVLKRKKWIVE